VLDGANRLARPVIVLDQGESHMPFAHRTEPDARRYRHQRFLEQQL
jgi:hypothetical protein